METFFIALMVLFAGTLAITMRKPAKKYKNGRVTQYNAWTDKW